MSRFELLKDEKEEVAERMREAHRSNNDTSYEEAWSRYKVITRELRKIHRDIIKT